MLRTANQLAFVAIRAARGLMVWSKLVLGLIPTSQCRLFHRYARPSVFCFLFSEVAGGIWLNV